jgi:bacterial/archaeal transporter family-2 protein
VDTGSREENASNQESRASVLIPSRIEALAASYSMQQAIGSPGTCSQAAQPAPCQCSLADNTDSDISFGDSPVQTILLYLAALGAGISVAVQQVLNGSLRVSLNSPAWAGFVSYLGGLITMIVVLAAFREPIPSWKLVTETPWWSWSGGILGGAFILLVILLLPSLGAATLLALVVAGQMSAAVTMDHFGAFGLTQHSMSVTRLLGVALIIGGVALIKD